MELKAPPGSPLWEMTAQKHLQYDRHHRSTLKTGIATQERLDGHYADVAMNLWFVGGLPRCLVITKSYGDIKTQGRYSVQCRRQCLHNTDTRWNCLPKHSPHIVLRTNVLPWLAPGKLILNSSLPYTDFKLLQLNFASSPLSMLPSPSLRRNGVLKPSSLLLTSRPR